MGIDRELQPDDERRRRDARGQPDEEGRPPRTGRGGGRSKRPPGDIAGREQEQRENEPERAGIEFLQLRAKEPGERFPASVTHPPHDREDDEQEGQERRTEPRQTVLQETRGALAGQGPRREQPGDEEEQPHREHRTQHHEQGREDEKGLVAGGLAVGPGPDVGISDQDVPYDDAGHEDRFEVVQIRSPEGWSGRRGHVLTFLL